MTFPGNENEVGQGIKESGVPREDIFITSKLWNTHQSNVKEGLQKTLDALSVDYLDLYVSRCQANIFQGQHSQVASANSLACSTGSGKHPVALRLSSMKLINLQNGSSDLLPVNPDGTRSVDLSWDQS